MWYTRFVTSGNQRTKGWWLVDSPIYPTLTLIAYFVLVKHLGPVWMRYREPFRLRGILMLYNAFQVFCCVWYIYQMGTLPLHQNYFCAQLETGNAEYDSIVAYLGWIYMLLKYLDLVDTVFFVLKKKQSHITFLHLFHHSSMVLFSWGAVKFHPGGILVFAPLLNVWVHLFMYSYYFLMAYNGSVPLYWKKKMTEMQIIQFVIGMVLCTVHVLNPYCNVSKLFSFVLLLQATFFVWLFGHFYVKTYMKRSL